MDQPSQWTNKGINPLFQILNSFESIISYVGSYTTGEIHFVSDSFEKTLGHSKERFIKEGISFFTSIVPPNEMIKIVNDLAVALKEVASYETPPIGYERQFNFFIYDSKGDLRFINQKGIVLSYTEENKMDLTLAILIDETEKKAKEQFLWQELIEREKSNEVLNKLMKEFSSVKEIKTNEKKKSELFELTIYSNPIRNIADREKEVLKLIADGFCTKQISEEMNISFHTAETHRKNLLIKFKAKNSAELIKIASKSYWLE